MLVGTEPKKNDLAATDGNIANISLQRPLGPYDWDLLESFDAGFSKTNKTGDCMCLFYVYYLI